MTNEMNARNTRLVWLIALGLIALAVAGRLLEHTPNFTPMAAVALFAAFYFDRLRFALLVPIAALVMTDVFLGGYEWPVRVAVYGAFMVPLALRPMLRKRLTIVRIGTGALLCSIVFFVVTNLAVWRWSGWYEVTGAGLAECFRMAQPFFKYTLLGDVTWSGALFGTYALVTELLEQRQAAKIAPEFQPIATGGR